MLPKKRRRPKPLLTATGKISRDTCATCGELLPVTVFDEGSSTCRPCVASANGERCVCGLLLPCAGNHPRLEDFVRRGPGNMA